LRPTLLAFCNSRIYKPVDAEDVAQNVVLILLKKKKDYNPNKSFYSWGMKICNFQIMSHLTNLKRNREDAIFDDSNNCSPDSLGHYFNKMPFQNLIQEEKQKVFSQIKSLLNSKEKEVISLSLEGWGAKDIIYRLKISRNAFTTAKSRAVKKARNFFKNKNKENYKL
jgi:RNA polymerase sigma factor (sigma-70 family)